jgi:ferritin-like metal-binding protein YciE
MPTTESLRTHLIDELIDLLDAENQIIQTLPELARQAASKTLRVAFQRHLKETRGHVARLNQALRMLGEQPRRKTCEGMQGLLEEGEAVMKKTPAGALRDAMMIAGAQKVEHYEMASYGTARTYAQVIGEASVARLLAQTLKEEKATDRTLTQIAEGSINKDANKEWHSQTSEGALGQTAEWAGSTAAFASEQLAKGVRLAASAVEVAQDRLWKRENARKQHGRGGSTSKAGRRPATKKR